MKKITTLFAALLMGTLAATAQTEDNSLQFVDADGNIIADGTTLTLSTVVDDGFSLMIPSGVYVRNTTDAAVTGGSRYQITALSNGAIQTCFPQNCIQRQALGQWDSEPGELAAGITKSIQTEWLPDGEGQASMTFQLLTYKYNSVKRTYSVKGYGPTLTLNFTYHPSSIDGVDANGLRVSRVEYFTLDGRRTLSPAHGVYFVRTSYHGGAVRLVKQRFK
jgi:hypothetical protein